MTNPSVAEPSPDGPRILVENGEYWLLNMGDLAMLDVTIRRLRARWPRARVGVLTETPALLGAYFPGVDPIVPWGRSAWSPAGPLVRLSQAAAPRIVGPYDVTRLRVGAWMRGTGRRAERLLRRGRPAPAGGEGRPLDPVGQASAGPAPNTAAALASSSLVVALGGGYLTDVDPGQTTRVLGLLEYASSRGVPTAMLGQGLGPLENPALMSRAAEVLPRVDVIALRERRCGPALLERVGVASSRVTVTGDDAIELALAQCPEVLGRDLGVCLRIAGYSPVSTRAREIVTTGLRLLAQALGAGLTPVIISEFRSEDRRSTLPLVAGSDHARRPLGRFARPQDVAAQVGRCRVLVTGAYHAAVFALSQGVPVVALTSSRYYDDKFLGLAGMFGAGLELVRLDRDDLAERLTAAIRSAWERAPEERAALLASAEEQIATSRRTFDRVCDLV
ncbi:polysaccharide pyruvyl transferase family protein [Geodermatophilus pulveris]|uniref:polysaccharide pyruvyl transferase family protein n=1 Tax=Geodermatophilus pulveris TaxID=1564159 RepID=UPI001C533BEA|nr:polysaccharide pyruvyl transferase family protein [Geodermatophilus pulveris]